jgi:hypothetical protein|tara:strand:- start:1046 stop:1222 length:177 start_codon:yes stop_codon:yes gene_type:complete
MKNIKIDTNSKTDLGIFISEATKWSPSAIMDIFQIALEDANAHTFNEALTELRKEHDW